MQNKNLEIYNPRKKLVEKIRPLGKPVLIILGILILIASTVYVTKYVLDQREVNIPVTENSANKIVLVGNGTIVDYSNFIQLLLGNEMIKDFPAGSSLNLKFYNFNSGERKIEKIYLLGLNSVMESSEIGEIQISIHSKYVNEFNSENLCDVLSLAKSNGDFGVETDLGYSEILWKYKSMLKYRDCLGL